MDAVFKALDLDEIENYIIRQFQLKNTLYSNMKVFSFSNFMTSGSSEVSTLFFL